jgi:hypothetical protein
MRKGIVTALSCSQAPVFWHCFIYLSDDFSTILAQRIRCVSILSEFFGNSCKTHARTGLDHNAHASGIRAHPCGTGRLRLGSRRLTNPA